MRHHDEALDTPTQTPPTLRTITPEDIARAHLSAAAHELGRTELRVLTRIAERLKAAPRAGGPFGIVERVRAFRSADAQREMDQALVFLACAWIKAETLEVAR